MAGYKKSKYKTEDTQRWTVEALVTLEEENIEHVDKTTNSDAITNYINAIGKKDGQLISLLDIVSLVVENN